jgi:hypothetical protein
MAKKYGTPWESKSSSFKGRRKERKRFNAEGRRDAEITEKNKFLDPANHS